MSYLHVNDIDYFRVSLGSTPPVTLPVSMVDRELREVNTSANTVKVGESAWLDIRFRNNSTRAINPSLTLSTNSGYVTVVDGNRSLGSVNMQNYKTLTSSQTEQPENARFYNGGSSTSNAFRFRVEDNCPDNEQINFTLTYTEGTATWQENFTITAQPRDRSVTIATPAANNCVLEENGGNADGRVNPGENAYLRITVRNTGTDATASLRAELSGFNTGHFTANAPNVSAISANSSSVITFNLSVNAACPTGLIGPFTLTLTETSGRQRKWPDTVPAVTIYLKPPAGLTVEPDGQSRARVSWTADSNARTYKVYHSTSSNGTFTNIGTVTHPAVSYVHSGVAGGANNYYKVAAVDANSIESAQSAAVTYSPLGIYGNVSVTEQNGNGDGKINPGETARLGITIRNPGTAAVTGLQASLSGFDSTITVDDNNQNIGTLNGNSSTTVYFTLNVNADCPTGPAGPMTLTLNESGGQYRTWLDTVPAFDITIRTPSNVRASADAYGSITVLWDAVSGDNVSYKVYASGDYWGTYTLLNTTKVTGTSYTHSGLGEGQTRYYKVSAVDSGNREGLQSSEAPSAISWYTLPAFNDLRDGGSIANGTIHHYRFPVINGTQYTVSWTGNIRVSAFRADGTGSAWFSNSTSSGQTATADITGYMVFKVEGTSYYGGDYSLQVDSGTQALDSFGFSFPSEGTVNGTINHTANTIDVIVPFQASLLSLTPVVTYPATGDVYCTGYTPTGAQNFTNPRKYVFNWSDGSKHTYTVTVTAKGQGDITIILPGMIEDETVGGFTGNITVSKTSAGYSSTHQIQVAAGYSSYEWYVDGAKKTADSGSEDRYFTIRAADYSVGRHTITIIVYKDGRPYSNEQSFTVGQ
jgi:fibronectin type 3 domain-containing protein